MVGKTANITLHWRGSWENTPRLRQMNCWFLLSNCLVYACEPKGEFDIWSWFTSKGLIPFHLVCHFYSLIFAMLKKKTKLGFCKTHINTQSNLHWWPPLNNSHFLADSPCIHSCFNLSTPPTSRQWPLSSVPKVAIVERFNCNKNN